MLSNTKQNLAEIELPEDWHLREYFGVVNTMLSILKEANYNEKEATLEVNRVFSERQISSSVVCDRIDAYIKDRVDELAVFDAKNWYKISNDSHVSNWLDKKRREINWLRNMRRSFAQGPRLDKEI